MIAWELKGKCDKAGEEFTWSQVFEFARFLLRSERTLHRLAEDRCNRKLWEHEEKREEVVAARVREECARLGVGVEFNRDPRGSAIKLRLPSGRANSFSGEKLWCVP